MEQKDKGLLEKLSELKDKVYELEGLLELAALRSEIITELDPLIKNKIKEITKMAGLSDESDISEPEDSTDRSDFSDYDSSDPMVEVLEKAFIEADDDIVEEDAYSASSDSIAEDTYSSTDKVSIYRPLKFCLNDRFRFVRTLFEGDNDRLNGISESLSKFDTCDEALDWLDREMSWDVEDPEVADFRELVSIYFQQNR